jgi:hypothetical protein
VLAVPGNPFAASVTVGAATAVVASVSLARAVVAAAGVGKDRVEDFRESEDDASSLADA